MLIYYECKCSKPCKKYKRGAHKCYNTANTTQLTQAINKRDYHRYKSFLESYNIVRSWVCHPCCRDSFCSLVTFASWTFRRARSTERELRTRPARSCSFRTSCPARRGSRWTPPPDGRRPRPWPPSPRRVGPRSTDSGTPCRRRRARGCLIEQKIKFVRSLSYLGKFVMPTFFTRASWKIGRRHCAANKCLKRYRGQWGGKRRRKTRWIRRGWSSTERTGASAWTSAWTRTWARPGPARPRSRCLRSMAW